MDHLGPPHPRQQEFLDIIQAGNHRKVLYGGARGGGKSRAMRYAIIQRRLRHPGSVGLLLRRTFPELRANHILKFFQELPPGLYRYDGQNHEIVFPNGSREILGYCRNDADVTRYQGNEYDDIAIDEVTQWQERWFDNLSMSCRSTRGNIDPIVFASCNPGGIGHAFVKRRWVDRDFFEGEDSNEYAFVQALVDDNPTLMQNDPAYVHELDSIQDPNLKRAWRFGDWDTFAGQYFQEIRRDIHGFTGAPPPGWTFRCLDYGESSPSAVYWVRVDRDGGLWFYRELYGAKMIYSKLAQTMCSMTPETEPIRYTIAPHDVFAVAKGTGVVGSETMAKHGVPVTKGDSNRIAGWMQVREFLAAPGAFHVSTDTCKNWWRTVPSQVYDEHNPEDLDTDGEDHCLVAGTMVDTADGQRRIIDLVGTEGIVWTPRGWQPYRNVRLTRRSQEVFRLSTADGRSVTATGDHRIMLTDGSWRELADLRTGDQLMDSARQNARSRKTRTTVEKVEHVGVADVYCLVVDNGHAFSVNGGLVVSNCADATRYGLMSRPRPDAAPREKPVRNTIDGILSKRRKRK